MAPHSVVELTSEASWAMVRVLDWCLYPSLCRRTDRGQVHSLWKGNSCKTHHISAGMSLSIINACNSLKFYFKDEVHPATKLAHLQLPIDPARRWKTVIPIVEELKGKAKKLGLWNLFLSKAHYPDHGVPLSNLEVRSSVHLHRETAAYSSSQYAVMAEMLGRGGQMASEVVNCSAPDTGNMGTVVICVYSL
jgi:hypothetical protein